MGVQGAKPNAGGWGCPPITHSIYSPLPRGGGHSRRLECYCNTCFKIPRQHNHPQIRTYKCTQNNWQESCLQNDTSQPTHDPTKNGENKMGFWDKLLGRDQNQPQPQTQPQQPAGNPYRQPQQGYYNQGQPTQQMGQPLTDEQAIARYRYMLQTAPPETIERAHVEAFSKLTPEQRRMGLTNLRAAV